MDSLNSIRINPLYLQSNLILSLYESFVVSFYDRLNPLDLSIFIIAASNQILNTQASMTFLKQESERILQVPDNEYASCLLQLEITSRIINLGELKESKDKLDELQGKIEGYYPAVVHAKFYEVFAQFYKRKGMASNFFKSSILFLGYSDVSQIQLDNQIAIAYDIGVAALVGEDIYNFGELLGHPIIRVLGQGVHQWLADLLFTFANGDIRRFDQIFGENLQSQEILQRNAIFLRQKIRILSLIEMLFRRTSSERSVSFIEISQSCDLAVKEVELLLMKALSLQLINGSIDEVTQTIRVKWIQPRILDPNQIDAVNKKLHSWSDTVHQSVLFLENCGQELFERQ